VEKGATDGAHTFFLCKVLINRANPENTASELAPPEAGIFSGALSFTPLRYGLSSEFNSDGVKSVFPSFEI